MGNMVLNGGGEPCREISGGTAPAGDAILSDAGVGALETFFGCEMREFGRFDVREKGRCIPERCELRELGRDVFRTRP
jgi:hypothetical protein